jgi:hypothetical protein
LVEPLLLTSREASEPRTFAVELPTTALSPAAKAVGESLGRWRARIAETQTLSRLILSLLQGFDRMSADRRSHLGRLLHIEARSLAQLPRLEFATLRSTTHARESGVDLRSADAAAAELHLGLVRDEIAAALRDAGDAVDGGDAELVSVKIEAGRRTLEDLSRDVDMLETMMYPRVTSPAIAIGVALERAGATRNQTILVEGEATAELAQVRGLLRLLSAFVESVAGHAYVHIGRAGAWIELSISASATGTGEPTLPRPRIEMLRFAAYLLRAQAHYADGVWRVAFVGIS